MKLFLAQHGDAVSKEVDIERPLSEKGQRDMKNMAGFLAQAGVGVAKVMHSGKTRTEQTAIVLAKAVMPEGEVETVSGITPNDDVAAFAATLASWEQDTFLVGHLPFMAKLVSFLLVSDANRGIVDYQPGSVVCLQRTEAGNWRLNWMVRPEQLS